MVRIRKMPQNTRQAFLRMRTQKKMELFSHAKSDSIEIQKIEQLWNVALPFSKQDQEEMR